MASVIASEALCAPGPPTAGWFAIDEGTIIDEGTGASPRGSVDLDNAVVAPGFVDLQCNGLGTVDFATATPGEWRSARRQLARHGVTALCATFVSAPLDRYPRLLSAAASACTTTMSDGADVLGVHLEGPFLGGAPGAHDSTLLRTVDVQWLTGLLAQHERLVRMVTLAPEADPGLEGTRRLPAAGVVVALGHTTASYDDAIAAADAGATVVTHLFNGMAPMHHREPGVAGAALADDRLTPTIIADLVHVHPAVVRATFAASPHVATVSDAVATVGGIVERDGAARDATGSLVGATMVLDGSLANLVAAGVPWPRAIASMTAEPARILGLTDRGSLRPGCRADFVALDPETFAVRDVWLHGERLDG